MINLTPADSYIRELAKPAFFAPKGVYNMVGRSAAFSKLVSLGPREISDEEFVMIINDLRSCQVPVNGIRSASDLYKVARAITSRSLQLALE